MSNNAKGLMFTLAMANVVIWIIAIIAMVFLMEQSQNVKGLFPILGGGTAVGIALISAISKSK